MLKPSVVNAKVMINPVMRFRKRASFDSGSRTYEAWYSEEEDRREPHKWPAL
jgi:hypothetical protein